ncbi:MAG: DUF5671 domain-containing protein [Nanoarchaeota archaeon]|nr:DUF5671 domain-containing protein [Nanoarchaeota archaeon]
MEKSQTTPGDLSRAAPRDFFLHLLHIVTLYGSAIALLSILWQLINIRFPDPTQDAYRYFAINGTIRWGVAFLVIMFPVLLGTGRFLENVYKKEPEKKELKIRKWLVYLTLFITALIIIGDLIRLIFEFLQGELTLRFILKFGSVLAVAAAIFWYYLQGMREREWKTFGWNMKRIFVWKVVIIIFAVVIGGVLAVDSPKEEQMYRRDERRVQDAQTLQNYTLEYWKKEKTLPENVDVLDIQAKEEEFDPRKDPKTKETYGYEVRGENTFALCVVFEKETRGKGGYPSPERPMRVPVDFEKPEPEYYIENSDWTHEAGKTCFERKIVEKKNL